MAGWASSAVSSVTGRGKKDKETFAALRDTDGEDSDGDEREYTGSRPASAMSSSSRKSQQHRKSKSAGAYSSANSPKPSTRDRKSARGVFDSYGGEREEQKVAVALHDFAAGSTDELSFKAGEHITVVSEVLDGWWMGEVDGRRGLFPTTYTEIVQSSSISSKPALPQRPSTTPARAALACVTSSSLSGSPGSSFVGKNPEIHEDTVSDSEGHPFGDHNVASSPASPSLQNSPGERSPGIGQFWPESDDDEEQLVSRQSVDDERVSVSYNPSLAVPPYIPRRATTSDIPSIKKPPPPPPPPRRSPNIAASSPSAWSPPPIPSRQPSVPSTRSSQSSSASLVAITNTPSLRGVGSGTKDGGLEDELTYSPFDSPRDLSFGERCRDFRQNPFKPKGFCSNCQQMHTLS